MEPLVWADELTIVMAQCEHGIWRPQREPAVFTFPGARYTYEPPCHYGLGSLFSESPWGTGSAAAIYLFAPGIADPTALFNTPGVY